jgi:hypothetical protein
MHETLREFAELVGRCLARRWLREREALKRVGTKPDPRDKRPDPASTVPSADDATPSNPVSDDSHRVG